MDNFIFSIFPDGMFVDLQLFQYGWEKCDSSHSFGPAKRNHYLFHYILSGKGTLFADGKNGITKTYNVKSFEGFMIFPGQTNTYIADSEIPWEYIWIEFDGLKVRTLLEAAGFSPDTPIYHAKYKNLREQMAHEMMYIKDNRNMPNLHIIGHLYLFIDYLIRSSSNIQYSTGNNIQDGYVQIAIKFIEENFQNNISVEEIADQCKLNRTYFSKLFKKVTGKSPQEFLLSYRMIKANELLKLTDMAIGDVANAVGYENQFHFSRAFKNTYNMSPRDWKRQNHINTGNSSAENEKLLIKGKTDFKEEENL